MREKLPMQELIDFIEELLNTSDNSDFQKGLISTRTMAIKLLSIECDKIKDAYDQGDWDAKSHNPDPINGEKYLSKKYEL
jgi:hypothetical protein